MSIPRPTLWLRIRSNIGPLTLLSVVTSVAFNRALLARERNEQHRLHRLQMSLLQQILSEASSTTLLSSSVLSNVEEQRRLARRMRALQLDPLQLGFSADVLPSAEEEEKLRRAREATTSWSSALFGSGIVSKVREAIGTSARAIRERGFGLESASVQQSSAQDEEDERWFRALEESLEGGDAAKSNQRGQAYEEKATLRSETAKSDAVQKDKKDTTRAEASLRETRAAQPALSTSETARAAGGRQRVYL